ncbi:unnamed protein product, partial [Mesorhabditis belari]|uniref:DMAP1-binding domain-containing protein n=1 Tax=Mesorhabditis belari TaxID=2138241 RepID=A0AAF3F3W4_9BILA
MPDIEIAQLPQEIREKLAELELELSEGDITQKGYDKKRNALLGPFLKLQASSSQPTASPSTRAHRRHQRRLTRDENRFHSEIRAEAVQAALKEYSTRNDLEAALAPLRRRGTNSSIGREEKKYSR